MSWEVSRRLLLVIAIVGTIGCDQVTKHVATSVLTGVPGRSYLANVVRFEYAENRGGFLGLGANLAAGTRTMIFTAATGLLLLGVVAVAVRQRLRGWALLGVLLFAAGGASNWVDRLGHGHVVDFMSVGVGPVRTGIFNVADVAIMLGGGLFVLAEFLRARHVRAKSGSPDTTA